MTVTEESTPIVGTTIDEVAQARRKLEEMKASIESQLMQTKALEAILRKQNDNVLAATSVINEKLGNLVDSNGFLKFVSKPYTTWSIPKSNKLLVFVPKFAKNFKGVGWLIRETDEYFVYEINQYSVFLGDVPEDLKAKVAFAKQVDGYVEGDTLYFEPSQRDAIRKKLGRHIDLPNMGDNRVRILRAHNFDLIADMIDAGCLPFKPKPIAKADLRLDISFKDWCACKGLEWRRYEQEYIDAMFQYGAIGVFAPTGAGKSVIASYFLDVLKGPHSVLYPRRLLAEQWAQNLEQFVDKSQHDQIELSTLQGFKDVDREVMFRVFDECQTLPADTLSRASLAPCKYRMGLSASNHREDGRESYIFALTGVPRGTNWQEYMAEVKRKYHPIHVHVLKNDYAKVIKTRELLDRTKKTLIFCDSIELGKRVSTDLDVPFVYGESNNRLDTIQDNQVVVISRVGDLGISIKDLQRIIEVDFLFGSRQQELQRTGRLMHSQAQHLRHDILMTEDEYSQYGKRLWALREKGFTIKVSET